MAISGLTALLTHYIQKATFSTIKIRSLFTIITMIVIAGLLRIHILGLCFLLMTWISFVVLPTKFFKEFLRSVFLISLLIGVFVWGHKLYYQKKIKDWDKEESTRQSLFYAYNRPNISSIIQADSITVIKYSLIKSLFLYDSAFISHQDILHYNKAVVRVRDGRSKEDFEALYWTFINNRALFLLVFACFLSFIIINRPSLLARWALIFLGCILLFFYLFIYYKITETILLALFSTIILSKMFLQREIKVKGHFLLPAYYTIILCSCFWMFIRLKKENSKNLQNIHLVRCAIKQLNNNSDNLFVSLGNIFPYGSFYIWDYPIDYPVKNLIYKELILTNSFTNVLYRFNALKLKEAILTKNNVFLIGNIDKVQIKQYYSHIKGWEAIQLKGVTNKCLNAYKIYLDSNVHKLP